MPSVNDIIKGSSVSSPERDAHLAKSNVDRLPIHITPRLGYMDLDALLELEGTEASRERALQGIAYLRDPEMYAPHLPPCTASNLVVSRGFTVEHTQQLLDAGLIELVHDPSTVKGSVINFLLPEIAKKRQRMINFPKIGNNCVPPAP